MASKRIKVRIRRKVKSVVEGWDLYKDGVSQSFIHCFSDCKEQTRLKFVELWTCKQRSYPLEFGNCFHWLDRWAHKFCKAPPTLKEIRKKTVEYEKCWLKANPLPWQKALEIQAEVYAVCPIVFFYYCQRWSSDFPRGKATKDRIVRPAKWEGLEEVFKTPYYYENHPLNLDGSIQTHNLSTFLRGMMDGSFWDKNKTPGLWLFETKTKGQINEGLLQDILPVDTQVMMYLYCLGIIKRKVPKGVLYNAVRRPGLRQGKTETEKAFYKRIGEDIEKRPDHYFIRWEMRIHPNEVIEWKKDFLDPVMESIRMWQDGTLPHFMNPDALEKRYGRADMFLPIVKQDFSACFKRKSVFNELMEGAL